LKVLAVEDDPSSLAVLEHLLRGRGDSVRSVHDGAQALRILDVESFDVVLMDIKMPNMDGLDATREIRLRDQRTGRRNIIIAVTARAMGGDREKFLAAGMDAYLSKPIRKDTLFHAIDTAIAANRNPFSGA